MRLFLLALSALHGAVSMDLPKGVTEDVICQGGLCAKPSRAYERIQGAQPGYQWNDAGGYCGSWSIQRATLTKGAYISQGQVRNHTVAGGGNDNEILSTNIEEAFAQLKIVAEGFDYVSNKIPQQDEYFRWLKRQLAAGHPVTWMIMWNGQSYPIYGLTPPAGMYGHVEPVVGIMSNHPLTDDIIYDDDLVVHLTDAGVSSVYREINSLKGEWGHDKKAHCGGGYRYCIGPYSFGWAIKDFEDTRSGALQASLHISPSKSEPDTRAGDAPNTIQGTLTVEGVEEGRTYEIYRWDAVADAFTYAKQYVAKQFVAPTGGSYVFVDPNDFASDSTTYYRVHPLKRS